MKIILKITMLTTIFSVVFYFIDLHISRTTSPFLEEPWHTHENSTEIINADYDDYDYKSSQKSIIYYTWKNYRETLDSKYKNVVEGITKWKNLQDKFNTLSVQLDKNVSKVRGKMKNKTVRIYAWHKLNISEFTSVFIHELSHYLDIYYLTPDFKGDKSDKFYEISWKSEKVLKAWQKTDNFVSGYSMTNRYEDFAESFTFYVLHNKEFYKRAQKNDYLMKKYLFFEKVLFENAFFKHTSFSTNQKYSWYFWDTTKLDINAKKFLNYIKNE